MPAKKNTPRAEDQQGESRVTEIKMEQKLQELLKPKFEQMQAEIGAQLTAQFAMLIKQLGIENFQKQEKQEKEESEKEESKYDTKSSTSQSPRTFKRATKPVLPPPHTPAQVKLENPAKKLSFGTPGTTAILQLIQDKYPKESVVQAANSTVALKLDNGEIFIARFMDYLKALGIDKAFRATRIKSIDPTTKKEVEVNHLANIKILQNDRTSSNRWEEAHLKLKSLLSPELYKELCVNNDKDGSQNFFDLWEQCMKKTGNKQTGETLLFKKQQFEKLELTTGSVLTTFISQVGATAEDINTLANSIVISDFEKNMKLHQQARQWTRFQFACQQTLSSIHTTTWRDFSDVFEIHKPMGQKGEEIPLGVPDTGIEPGGDKGNSTSELANAVVTRCNFCKKLGHIEENCRTRQYQGFRVPNGKCKGWVMTGACHWERNPKNTAKTSCKFNHSPATRNKKNWQATRQPPTGSQSIRQPPPQASAQAVTTKEEKAELLTMIAKNLLKAKTTNTTEEHHDDHQPTNGAAFGVTDEELAGVLSLVNGMPDNWSCHVHHNAFEVLGETEEKQDQETESATPPTDQEPSVSAPSTPTGIEPEWWLITFMCLLWKKLLCYKSKKSKKKKKKQQAKAEHALHTPNSRSTGRGAILLDSACSKSNTPHQYGLTKLITKFVRMFTADNSSNLSTTEGTMTIEGMPVRVSVCPTFDKTLVSLGELDKQGVTWTGGKGIWTLYDKDGVVWTTLKRGADNLYHFEKAEL